MAWLIFSKLYSLPAHGRGAWIWAKGFQHPPEILFTPDNILLQTFCGGILDAWGVKGCEEEFVHFHRDGIGQSRLQIIQKQVHAIWKLEFRFRFSCVLVSKAASANPARTWTGVAAWNPSWPARPCQRSRARSVSNCSVGVLLKLANLARVVGLTPYLSVSNFECIAPLRSL